MNPIDQRQAHLTETYRITGFDGGTGQYVDVTRTFTAMPGFATAKEVASDWAYNYLDKGCATLTLVRD